MRAGLSKTELSQDLSQSERAAALRSDWDCTMSVLQGLLLLSFSFMSRHDNVGTEQHILSLEAKVIRY